MAALGEIELTLGRTDAALARFEELRAVLRSRGIGDPDLRPAPELAEIYLRLGRGPEAAKVAEEFTRDAEAKAQPWALARAARCRGLIAAEGESDPHFETALVLHGQTPDAFETGRTHLAYGARLRRERQRVRAREQLRAAVEVFDRLGADPWSEMARAELAATGETARRRDVTTLNDLTPQELQIALSLAEGRTTREAEPGRGAHDQRNRHCPVPEPEDHRVSPAQCVPQVRHRIAERTQGRDGPARGRISLTGGARGRRLQQLRQHGRGPGGAVGFHRAVVDRAVDLGDDGLGEVLGVDGRVVQAPPGAVLREPVGHVDLLLEVAGQRHVDERPARRDQFYGRGQAALDHRQVAGGQVPVQVRDVAAHLDAVGHRDRLRVDPRSGHGDHPQAGDGLLGQPGLTP